MNARTAFREETQVAPRHGDDAVMTYEVGKTLSAALTQGDAVVCIAAGSRRRRLEEHMKAFGIDVVGALMREQLVCLNALDTLMKVVVGDAPDVVRFAEVIGAVADRAATRYPHVVTYSELPHYRDVAGALELETLLTSFLNSRPVFFRCRNPNSFDPRNTQTPVYRSIKRVQSS